MDKYQRIKHTFEPVFNEKSKILILGSFPSIKSREEKFYYGHPQNRFWKVMAHLLQCQVPKTIQEKKEMLLLNNIAIWDVISSCDIIDSSDSSIKNVIPNNFNIILSKCQINNIFGNGKTASIWYKKLCEEEVGKKIIQLPSTSPANARYKLQDLINAWSIIGK